MSPPTCYLATVALERNRWGSREPSLRVSDWLDRLMCDGFNGVELWEPHFTAADDAERARLIARSGDVAVFNSYAGFGDTDDEIQQRADSAAAVARLYAKRVKYNLGNDADRLGDYRRNLGVWAGQLPDACRLLCECHPGTVLEAVDTAAAFFADLDRERFGIIAHVAGDAAALEHRLSAFGGRVEHLHLQLRTPEADPASPGGRERLAACAAALKRHDYRGTTTIEFTRGIGPDEQIEVLYQNARDDLAAFREAWQTA